MRMVRDGVSAGLAWGISNPDERLALYELPVAPRETRRGANPLPRTISEFA